MKTSSEKLQAGNPHQLVRRQHVFPRKSIERFVSAGGVDLLDLNRNLVRRARADDDTFCAVRVWNHGAETGWMKEIEDAFQGLANEVLSTARQEFTEAENEVIAEFFGLWQARAKVRHLSGRSIKHTDILGVRRAYTADELERLEKNNIGAFRSDGSLSLRDVIAPWLRLEVDRTRIACAGRGWGLLSSEQGEFCVPDVPSTGIIPLTPVEILALDNAADVITEDEVGTINRTLRSGAEQYLFARSITACPGLSH